MFLSFQKKQLVALLIFTSMLQGWPLLVAAMCTMAEPQTMHPMEACCCCDNSQSSAAIAFSGCSPGKKLAGVLGTEPFLKSDKEKKAGEGVLQQPASETPHRMIPGIVYSSRQRSIFTSTILLHTASPPVFLLDSVFRI